MNSSTLPPPLNISSDLIAGLVVFLVALPLCLGVALASGAPLLSGILSGIIGGIVVGIISRSHTSVSGPAAGLAAVVAAEISGLGDFRAFLLAVFIAGLIQIGLGLAKAGFIANFIPNSVIKGLLAAIGVLLILKQLPHLLGHDADPEGDMSFAQPDGLNTFSEISQLFDHFHASASVIGLSSIALLVLWGRIKWLKSSVIPAPLVVVFWGISLRYILNKFAGEGWALEAENYVQVPVAQNLSGFLAFLQWPDFSQLTNPSVYTAAITIAIIASLETLLNLEAVDKLDPQQRVSPPSRELFAQGIGNVTAGLIGGIPITSVIVRSSVNINAGSKTKLSAIIHGVLLLVSVVFLPNWLNAVPISCLAAILLVTGIKLASPQLVKQMWSEGRFQFVPFAVTVIAIVMTDLLIGVLIGLAVSISFILRSNLRRPIRRFVEKHLGGDVVHIELANQVSFLNRAALLKVLNHIPRGGQVLIDARNNHYIDPDVLDLLRDYSDKTAPARDIKVSLLGFRNMYHIKDKVQYVQHSTEELQQQLTPEEVLQILKDGHRRFTTGRRLTRNLGDQVHATSDGQHPLAVVLSCIDSRAPAELIFDVGLGDILSIRIAGNIISPEVLGSMEYACAMAGAKLILIMGHTRCGAVTTAVELASTSQTAAQVTGCQHIDPIINLIQESVTAINSKPLDQLSDSEMENFVNAVARGNVSHVAKMVFDQSQMLNQLHQEGRLKIVGAIYDVVTGDIEFL